MLYRKQCLILQANKMRKDFISNEILNLKIEGVDVFHLNLKFGSDNFHASIIQGIIKPIKAKGIPIIVYESAIKDGEFYN